MIIISNSFKTPFVRKLVLASAAATAFVSSGLYFDWGKSDWASWVQAAGSIGAILASGWLANWQFRKTVATQESQRSRDHLVPAVAILTLMRELEFEGNRGIAAVREMINNDRKIAWDDAHFLSGIEESFRAIPLWQLPTPEIVRDLAAIIRFIPTLRDMLRTLHCNFQSQGWDLDLAERSMNGYHTELRIWVESFERHVTNLGGDPNTGTHMGL